MTVSVTAVESVVKYSFLEKGIQTQFMGRYKAELTLYTITDNCDNSHCQSKDSKTVRAIVSFCLA